MIALEGVYRTLVERQLSGMFDIVKSDDADADADSEAQWYKNGSFELLNNLNQFLLILNYI